MLLYIPPLFVLQISICSTCGSHIRRDGIVACFGSQTLSWFEQLYVSYRVQSLALFKKTRGVIPGLNFSCRMFSLSEILASLQTTLKDQDMQNELLGRT